MSVRTTRSMPTLSRENNPRAKIAYIKGDEFTEFIKWVQAAVYGRVEPDDRQIAAARKLYTKVRAYTYLGLGFKDRFVWKYVKCYDCGGRRRKR